MTTAKHREYSERIADEMIARIENGTAPWVKPWAPGEAPPRPLNAKTGVEYRGGNSLWLEMQQPDSDPRWMTYNQAQELGAQVKKGEKGTQIERWIFDKKELVKDDQGKPILDDEGNKQYDRIKIDPPQVRVYTVFHASQVEGLSPWEPKEPPRNEIERHTEAERLIRDSGAIIHHDQRDRAFYRPSTDQIHLPQPEQFASADAYYATTLHEIGHWTGHESRLDRSLINRFGSEEYAREELRAELSSYMVGRDLGIGHDPGQHAAYVGSWVKKLKEDPREIYRAARDAERIRDYVMQPERQQEYNKASQEHTDSAKGAREGSSTLASQKGGEAANPAQEKTWLDVPYRERNAAKEHGAKWDRTAKSWYAPAGTDLEPLHGWMRQKEGPAIPAEQETESELEAE